LPWRMINQSAKMNIRWLKLITLTKAF
jgi:hypothetical protein